jgi:hypothetical protein
VLDVLDDVAQDREVELGVRVGNALAVEAAAVDERRELPTADGIDSAS